MYRKNEDRIGSFLAEEIHEVAGATLLVNDLFQTYRMWSESRGERSMTQIAFHRKLVDRGMPIIGEGNKAYLQNYDKISRQATTVSSDGNVDWKSTLKYSNNF